jgi:hypothetical protein
MVWLKDIAAGFCLVIFLSGLFLLAISSAAALDALNTLVWG